MCRIRRENRRSTAINARSITKCPIHDRVMYIQAMLLYSDEFSNKLGIGLEISMAVGAVNCVAYLHEHCYDIMIPIVLCRFTLSRIYAFLLSVA
jgi:hypothetical protein